MITCFTLSLSRFCGMKRTEALVLTNLCARSNFYPFRTAAPDERRGEIRGLASFFLWNEGMPYQTEVQLYKAIQALLLNMGAAKTRIRKLPPSSAHC